MSTTDKIALLAAGIAAASVLIGLVALLFAFRANRISASALQLANRSYVAERRLSFKSS
jgi:hypothetical protein